MAQGRTFAIRTFLEGIEIDCIGATVTSGLNQPCQAQVEIPSVDAAHELLPRTLIHIFWQETSYESHDGTATNEYRRDDPTRWKLLFAGEVLALGYAKAGDSRSCYLSCQDFSSYWQAAQLYWGTNNNSHNSYKKAILMGSTWLRTGANKVSNGSALANLLSARPTSIPTMSGVLGGIVALLEAATGIYNSKGATSYAGVNDFMSQAELRLHLTRMIGAAAADDTSATFLKYGDMRQYFQRLTAAVQSTTSFMKLAEAFLEKIYHTWTSVAAPPYMKQGMVSVTQEVATKINYNFDKEVNDEYLLTKKAYLDTDDRVTATQQKSKDKDNTLYADVGLYNSNKDGTLELDTAKHDEFSDKVTPFVGRKDFNHELGPDDSPRWHNERQEALLVMSNRVWTEANGKKSRFAKARAQNIQLALTKSQGAISKLAEVNTAEKGADGVLKFNNHTAENLAHAHRLLSESIKAFERGAGVPVKLITTLVEGNPRLHSFLFTPDLFMVPPPRCNVLFPDQYMSVQYNRNWLSETTRLWLFGQTTAGTEQLTGYFSPNTDILGGPKAADAAIAAVKGLSFLMPHEIYSGPIPVIKALGDINVFKRLHGQNLADAKKAAKTKVAGPTAPDFTGQAKYSPNESLQRAANYLFFAERFAGRTMSVEAKFSPQIIPGLPMLLIDSVEGTVPFIKNMDGETFNPDTRGTHYLGVPTTITHTIKASGGAATSIQMQKCRRHNEGVDLFGGHTDSGGVTHIIKKVIHTSRRVVHKGVNKASTTLPTGNFLIDKNAVLVDPLEELKAAGITGLPADAAKSTVTVTYDGSTVAELKRPAPKGKKPVGVPGHVFEGDELTETVVMVGAKKYTVTTKYTAQLPDKALSSGSAGGAHHPDKIGTFNANTAPDSLQGATVLVANTEISIEVTNPINKPLSFTFEGTTTPPWFASIYLPHNIGPQYYGPMLGCGSVLDQVIQTTEKGETVDHTISFPSATGDITRNISVPQELTNPSYSVQQAAEQLSETWVGLQQAGANMPLFTETYNNRQYATMLDIMGNINEGFKPRHPMFGNEAAGVSPTEGFHGNAYGPLKDFEDCTGFPMEAEESLKKITLVGKTTIKQPKPRKIDAGADPRYERYVRVAAYLNQVNKLRASMGQGG